RPRADSMDRKISDDARNAYDSVHRAESRIAGPLRRRRVVEYGAVLFQLDGCRGPPFARGHALQELQSEHFREVLETLLHNRQQILIVDVFLTVRELTEQLVGTLQLGLRQLVTKLFIALGKRMPAGVFSQHNLVRG